MKVKSIYYEAKDGKIFTDPLACEDYEKTIGIVPGSVGDVINYLEKHKPDDYVNATVVVRREDGSVSICHLYTVCCDGKMDLFVNPESLSQEQRYFTATFADIIKWLGQFDKDLPCQYMIVYSDDIDMNRPGLIANHSVKFWERKEEKK